MWEGVHGPGISTYCTQRVRTCSPHTIPRAYPCRRRRISHEASIRRRIQMEIAVDRFTPVSLRLRPSPTIHRFPYRRATASVVVSGITGIAGPSPPPPTENRTRHTLRRRRRPRPREHNHLSTTRPWRRRRAIPRFVRAIRTLDDGYRWFGRGGEFS